MSFLTTSTVTEPSLSVVSIGSVFLLLLDDEKDALNFIHRMKFLKERLLYRLLARRDATPCVWPNSSDCLIDLDGKFIALIQVAVERTQAWCIDVLRCLFAITRVHSLRKIGDSIQ